MKRRLTLEVRNKAEFEAIKRGLDDPEARALVVIIGTLLPYDKKNQAAIMTAVTALESVRSK